MVPKGLGPPVALGQARPRPDLSIASAGPRAAPSRFEITPPHTEGGPPTPGDRTGADVTGAVVTRSSAPAPWASARPFCGTLVREK